MMLIGAGASTMAGWWKRAEALSASLVRGPERSFEPARFAGGDVRGHDDLEQAHLAFAFPALRRPIPMPSRRKCLRPHWAAACLRGCFQEAREKRGLCYSSMRSRTPIAIPEWSASTPAPPKTKQARCSACCRRNRGHVSATSEEEAARARAQLKAALLMGLESPHQRCELIAGHLYTYGRVLSVEELIARVDAVDAAAIRNFAARILRGGNPAIAAVGPVKHVESRDVFARRFGSSAALASVQ
jgi:predicted Zn-dependent peptidase